MLRHTTCMSQSLTAPRTIAMAGLETPNQTSSLAADLWASLAPWTGTGPFHVSFVLPTLPIPQPGLNDEAAWIASWLADSRDAAAKALTEARTSGTARVMLGSEDRAGPTKSWEVVLSRVVGRDAIVAVARDVTEQVVQDFKLRSVAYQDGLTGLLNRAALTERLTAEIAAADAKGGSVTLLMIDLDNFKLINDTLGHDAGDAVLIEAAARLRANVPSTDACGRLGGDEFAVIITGNQLDATNAFLAEDLLDALRQPIHYKGRVLDSRASIGMATFPQHGVEPSELLKNADVALYASKSFGRGGFTTYVPSMANTLRKRAVVIAKVREALAQYRYEVFYQPKMVFGSKSVVGYEALLRLRDAEGALIAAQAIHQAFDDIDLARDIGDRMFERVAIDVRRWLDAGIPVGRIALNASAAEFRAGDFAPRFLAKLHSAGLSPEMFEIEVAETVLAGRGTDYVATALADLAEAGVTVALDEFGTGASSLTQLKRLPFHSLKIDRTFVGALDSDPDDQAIVRAIIGLAHGLGLGMTAVGVETPAQMKALRDLGCTVGQGNFLGVPISAHEIDAQK